MNTLEYLLKLQDGTFTGPLKRARDEQGRFIAQGREVGKNSSQVNMLGGAFTRLVPMIAAAGAALLATTGLGAAFAVKTAAATEQTLIQFETLTGGMEQAKATLAELTALGASTPFELPQLTEAAKKLLAARVPTSALKDELSALGNVSAATGADIGNLTTVYGQMAGKGKIYAEDMQQFVEAGAGEIKQALAESLGVSTSALNDLMSDGRVGFSDMQKAVQGLAGASGKWAAAMEKQSKTTIGLWSTLKDNVTRVFDAIGQPINDGPVKSFLTRLVNITGSAGTMISNAIQRGQVGETLKNALSLGAKLGINAVIGFIETLPDKVKGVFSKLAQAMRAALMGNTQFLAELLSSWKSDALRFDTSKEEEFFKNLTAGAEKAKTEVAQVVGWAQKLDAVTEAADKKEKARAKGEGDEKNGRKKIMGFSYAKSGANSGFGGLDEFYRLQEIHLTGPDEGKRKNKAFHDGAFKMHKAVTEGMQVVGQEASPQGMKRRMMGGGLDEFHARNKTTGLKPAFTPSVTSPGTAKNQQARREAAATAARTSSSAHPLAAEIKEIKTKLNTLAVAS